MQYLLLLHVNNGYADRSKCYAICTLSILHFVALQWYLLKHNTTAVPPCYKMKALLFFFFLEQYKAHRTYLWVTSAAWTIYIWILDSHVRLNDPIILIRSVYSLDFAISTTFFLYTVYMWRRLQCENDVIGFTYTVFVNKPIGERPPGRPRKKRQCNIKKGVTATLRRSQEDGTFRGSLQWPNFVKTLLDRLARHVRGLIVK
jgi:hypothetical protein